MSYFLDTNIVIYYLKGSNSKIMNKLLSNHPSDIKIPSIVKAELLYGVEKSQKRDYNLKIIEQFLMTFEIIPFDNDASEVYGKVRFELESIGRPIGPNDLIIASTVLSKKGILITNNIREFERIENLKIENWTWVSS